MNKVTRLIKTLKHNLYTNKVNITKDKTNDNEEDDTDELRVNNEQNTDSHNNDNNSRDKTMWNTVKDMTNKLKQQPPRLIIDNNEKVTSLKKIAHIANRYFIDKIKKLRDTFLLPKVSPITILNYLIPRREVQFKLQPITIERTMKIIKNAKGSFSLGTDIINMKVLKKINKIIAPHITHLINNIILTQSLSLSIIYYSLTLCYTK